MKKDSNEEVEARIEEVEVWYHVMELAPGIETPGIYDLRPFLGRFHFPRSLEGRTVLDVGTSNGFFAFLFESLGARRVVATNLRSYKDHDYPRWYVEKVESENDAELLESTGRQQSTAGFEVARDCLGSRVDHLLTTIYELPRTARDRFDFVFCGYVLLHLRDPVGGLEAIREVMVPGGELTVATPIDLTEPDQSYAMFMGKPEEVSWWVVSPACLLRMCRMAGFRDAEWLDSFVITSRNGITDTVGVVRCTAP